MMRSAYFRCKSKTLIKQCQGLSTSVLQLHFIQCPFPNQIQFGLENHLPKIYKYFQTKSSLVWKIIMSNFEGNKFQTKSSLVWEKMLTIVDDKNPKPILVWFGKTVSPNDNNFDIMQPAH